ncbi:pseudouridine synthase [Cesiribacter andamanensis]|uniref:Pseudouridine synthase n=1 Tax=Cesiribacter andamanensis AMV16 TaxID=1279009 RepID=M7NKB5_9BACT|nr:pseudouridine synthase [Cesiribacter andamanensis]EMR02215.1 Ribosomal large subunit pseudouridine synthase E [Cesiribacter andamanensis AMV16]
MARSLRPSAQEHLYYCLHKPYGVLSQFTPEGEHAGLGSLFDFPEGVYPVGRLDADSEGLLLLTSDTQLNHRLLDPRHGHWRTYWVQVEGTITPEALQQLRKGVSIRINKKDYQTLPAQADLLPKSLSIPERTPPIRFRLNVPTSWIWLRLQEGKNRQVRRMTAAVGFPTLRLMRVAIEELELAPLQPGELRQLNRQEIYRQLKLTTPSGPSFSGRRQGVRSGRNNR